MALTKIKELTASEAVALAFANFAHDRFTTSSLTTFLSALLSDSFKIGHIQIVDGLMRMAVSTGALQCVPGKRGGPGYAVTKAGVAAVAEVELPADKFQRRADADEERQREANADVGPVFEMLARIVPQKEMKDRHFSRELYGYWLSNGWLSSKQVAAMAVIATKYGEFIHQPHYVGKSMPEWTAPYIERHKRQVAADYAAELARVEAEKRQRIETERVKKLLRDKNRLVKAALLALEDAGGLAELDAVVAQVFPGVSASYNARATAYAGTGSKALRVCVAAIAFGRPPALVWEEAAGKGAVRQPNADSEEWKTLVAHPGFQLPLQPQI